MALSPVASAPASYAMESPRPAPMQAVQYAPEPREPVIDRAFHATLVDEFEAAEDASRTNRNKAERDQDYYDGKQWTEEEVRELRKRGQPAIALNLIRQKIDYLQGLERAQRTKPRALPRTPMHEKDAAAVGDALQFIAEDNRYDQTRSRVWRDLLIVGWGGVETSKEDVAGGSRGAPAARVLKKRCAWDRMWWDPFSSADDFEDCRHRGLVLWMDRTDAVLQYGEEAGKVFDETVTIAQVGGTYDDKPKYATWIQAGNRKRIRVVQSYRTNADGEIEFWEYTKGGILLGGPSPWIDDQGKRTHPYDWATAYIDRDNNRYGVVRDMIDPQDEANKRRSKALHHFTVRQTFGTPSANGLQTVQERRKQLAMPDGHVEMPENTEFGKQFGIIPTNDQGQAHFEMLQQVMQVFETMGPNASMQGKGAASQSGRAVLANQQGGAIQMGTLTDTLRDMDHRTYRRDWNMVRQFWTGETWIRVTDDEKNLRWVGLNTPMQQPLMMPGTGQPIVDPQTGQPVMQPAIDPMTGAPIMQNVLAEIDADIIIDDAPEAGTMLDEQFALLVQLKGMDTNNEIPFKALIAAAPNLRSKDKLLEGIEQREKAPPNPVQMAAAQAELENKAADTTNKLASADLSEARAAQITIGAVHSHAAAVSNANRGGLPANPAEMQPPAPPGAS